MNSPSLARAVRRCAPLERTAVEPTPGDTAVGSVPSSSSCSGHDLSFRAAAARHPDLWPGRSFRDLAVQNYREAAVRTHCAVPARLREQEPIAGSCPDLVDAAHCAPELPVAGQQVFPARTRC